MLVSWRNAALLTVALSAGLVGCGSSEEDTGEGTEPVVEGPPTLEIFFPKIYSAYIEGSAQEFRVPAVVGGVAPDKWEVSEEGAVTFDMDTVPNGVMITTRKAGKFKIIARSGRQWGEAELEVTAATEEELATGEMRYNNAVMLDFMGLRPMMGQMPVMQNASCKNCHGSGATALAVEHTPQQTGGYSDDEIKAIFSMGQKPEGAMYGSFPGIAMFYPLFHRWAASEDEYQGLVVYLRSMMPASQGPLDFMGLIEMFRRANMGRGMAGAGAAGSTAGSAGSTAAAGAGGEAAAAGAGGETAAAGAGGEAAAAGAGGEAAAAGAGGEAAAAGAGGEAAAAGAGGEAAAGAGGAAAGAGGSMM
jgi:hypothetical protein